MQKPKTDSNKDNNIAQEKKTSIVSKNDLTTNVELKSYVVLLFFIRSLVVVFRIFFSSLHSLYAFVEFVQCVFFVYENKTL